MKKVIAATRTCNGIHWFT